MSVLSANTLFHFTKKEAILGILNSGFRASFCLEFDESEGHPIEAKYITMVCFCDLPISMLDNHINGYKWVFKGKEHEFKGYGRFGLGMTKEWGIKNMLNPVTYVNPSSIYSIGSLHSYNIQGLEMDRLRNLIVNLKRQGSKDAPTIKILDELFFKLIDR